MVQYTSVQSDLAGKKPGLSTLLFLPPSHTNIHMQEFAVNLTESLGNIVHGDIVHL